MKMVTIKLLTWSLWKTKIENNTIWHIFDLTKTCQIDSLLSELFSKSLGLFESNIEKYFPSLDVSSIDWVRNPFNNSVYESTSLTTDEESELINIRNNCGLELQYSKSVEDSEMEAKTNKTKLNVDIAASLIPLLGEHPSIAKKVMKPLLPFSTSYICEAASLLWTLWRQKTAAGSRRWKTTCEFPYQPSDQGRNLLWRGTRRRFLTSKITTLFLHNMNV